MATTFQERLMKEEDVPQHFGGGNIDPEIIKEILELNKKKDTDDNKKDDKNDKEKPDIEEVPINIIRTPAEIKILSGDNQDIEVDTKLPDPIIVQILDNNGNPLEREKVLFSTETNNGIFGNNKREQIILTNDDGIVETSFTLGKIVGEKIITISLQDSDLRPVTLLCTAKATPAAILEALNGNHQIGQLGKKLPKPFAVVIRDKFENPIPRYEVVFNLKKGEGKFQGGVNGKYIAYTNEDGLAEVFFIIGNKPGAREIEIEAKKVVPSKIDFEVFAV